MERLAQRLRGHGMERQGQQFVQLYPGLAASIVFGNVLFLRKVRELEGALVLNQHGAHHHQPPGQHRFANLAFQGQPHKLLLVQHHLPDLLFIIRGIGFHCHFTTRTGHVAFSIKEWLTLPMIAPRKVLRPRVPTTMISACVSSAACKMPSSTRVCSTTRPETVTSGDVTRPRSSATARSTIAWACASSSGAEAASISAMTGAT